MFVIAFIVDSGFVATLHVYSKSRKYYLWGVFFPHSGYRTSGPRAEFAYIGGEWHKVEIYGNRSSTNVAVDGTRVPDGVPSAILIYRHPEIHYGLLMPCVTATRKVPWVHVYSDIELRFREEEVAGIERALLQRFAIDVLNDGSKAAYLRGGDPGSTYRFDPFWIAHDLAFIGLGAIVVRSFTLRSTRSRLRRQLDWCHRRRYCPRCRYDRVGFENSLCSECGWPRSFGQGRGDVNPMTTK
ncbi:MAG: hypothetical protein IBJ18_00780 [Phycisphaerales bacterium]|nr:hypothetical protein [Phycisphaerales bacterium]